MPLMPDESGAPPTPARREILSHAEVIHRVRVLTLYRESRGLFGELAAIVTSRSIRLPSTQDGARPVPGRAPHGSPSTRRCRSADASPGRSHATRARADP